MLDRVDIYQLVVVLIIMPRVQFFCRLPGHEKVGCSHVCKGQKQLAISKYRNQIIRNPIYIKMCRDGVQQCSVVLLAGLASDHGRVGVTWIL